MFTADTITEEQSAKVSGLLHIAADIEHIGDHCKNISEFADEKIKNSYDFSEEAYGEICGCFDLAKKMAAKSMTKAAERTALFTGESACVWWQYQPKAPAALKKMKKR